MIDCYHCIKKVEGFPHLAVSLIGTTTKEFKKDFFDFCPKCFEHLFGIIVFSTQKKLAISCHMCESLIIESVPYSYFMSWYKLTNGDVAIGRRRICGPCSKRELFPIINSLLIVKP
jgi:hypothetical protein